ncbi:hypothetical protein AVEN_81711-1 [Araneus ventricosus]|uniref:Uncharacterized protein n=1 Tax=Araneus ventricosus TaxID=182803 RepID=A0A4Y2IB67_ARAVE|nr:hypothetical protein AVEN_81711-1 [Araneus ventricosus]
MITTKNSFCMELQSAHPSSGHGTHIPYAPDPFLRLQDLCKTLSHCLTNTPTWPPQQQQGEVMQKGLNLFMAFGNNGGREKGSKALSRSRSLLIRGPRKGYCSLIDRIASFSSAVLFSSAGVSQMDRLAT